MKNISLLSSWTAQALVLAGAAYAQEASKVDHDIFYSFVHMHFMFSADIEKARLSNPRTAEDIEQRVTMRYGLDKVYFPKITEVGRSMVAKMVPIDEEMERYVKPFMEKRVLPDVAKLQQFADRKVAVMRAAISELHAALPAPAWKALVEHLAEVSRHIVRVPAGTQKPAKP